MLANLSDDAQVMLSRSDLVVALLIGWSIGCSGQPKSTITLTKQPLPVPPARELPQKIEGYVPSDRAIRDSAALEPKATDGKGGVLAGGIRIAANGERCHDVAQPALIGGVRLPKRMGEGFLFWNTSNLYFARSATAILEPILGLPASNGIGRVSFGPSFLLLQLANGGRIAWSPKDRRTVPMPNPGLRDVAALDDGRAAMLLEPNQLMLRGAGQQDLQMAKMPQVDLTELRVAGDEILLNAADGPLYALTANGAISEAGPAAKELWSGQPSFDPRWHSQESPRERALQRGVPLDGAVALVDADGAFAKVDLRTGTLVGMSEVVVAGVANCQLLPMLDDTIAVCRTTRNDTVVIAGTATENPHIERSFVDHGPFYAGEPGTLVKGGTCDGPKEAKEANKFSVCVRSRLGKWHDLAVSRDIAAPNPWDAGVEFEPNKAEVKRWIPTADGGALGLLSGGVTGLIDMREQVIVPFASAEYNNRISLFAADADIVDTNFSVGDDGAIVGYGGNGSLRLSRDGKLQLSPHAFGKIWSSGAVGIGIDPRSGLWQSLDFGRNWRKVADPPGHPHGTGLEVVACSYVGCNLGRWFRLGYANTGPEAEQFAVARNYPLAGSREVPRLSCFSSGTVQRRFVGVTANAEGNVQSAPHFGAHLLPTINSEAATSVDFAVDLNGTTLLQAAFTSAPAINDTSSPLFGSAIANSNRLYYHELFAKPQIRETSFTWRSVLSTLMRARGDIGDMDYSSGGSALPVLSLASGKTEGLLLFQAPFYLWLRQNKPVRVAALPSELDGEGIISAVADRKNEELTILVKGPRLRVAKSGPNPIRTLLEFPTLGQEPPNPEVLAVGSDGTVRVLRIWSQDPPTADDPALVLSPGQVPMALAPWSTLTAGNCSGSDGYRAIVIAGPSWLDVELAGAAQPRTNQFLAMVHWNQQRVCLEAIECPVGELTIGATTSTASIVARFDAGAFAERYLFDKGVEYNEPLECKLVTP
jgi:hypothetical protein